MKNSKKYTSITALILLAAASSTSAEKGHLESLLSTRPVIAAAPDFALTDEEISTRSKHSPLEKSSKDRLDWGSYDFGDSRDITDLTLCMKPDTTTNYEKYFWMSIATQSKVIKGSCLLHIPKGASKDGDWNCCTSMTNPTPYSSSYVVAVTDPKAIPMDSGAYNLCGPQGGPACQDYDYDHNEVGFARFQVGDGDGAVLQTMTTFIFGSSGGCGLTDWNGDYCDIVNKEYDHAHVGKGYCLEGAVTLEKAGSGCDVYGWKCLKGNC
jgi:hypothetical protein